LKIKFSEPVHDTTRNVDKANCAKHVLDNRNEYGNIYEITTVLETVATYLQ